MLHIFIQGLVLTGVSNEAQGAEEGAEWGFLFRGLMLFKELHEEGLDRAQETFHSGRTPRSRVDGGGIKRRKILEAEALSGGEDEARHVACQIKGSCFFC